MLPRMGVYEWVSGEWCVGGGGRLCGNDGDVKTGLFIVSFNLNGIMFEWFYVFVLILFGCAL